MARVSPKNKAEGRENETNDDAAEESKETKAYERAEKEDKKLHKTVNKLAKKVGAK